MGRKDLMSFGLLIGLTLFLTSKLWIRALARQLQQRLPPLAIECDQLLLWSGLFLSAVSIGLLALYLILQP